MFIRNSKITNDFKLEENNNISKLNIVWNNFKDSWLYINNNIFEHFSFRCNNVEYDKLDLLNVFELKNNTFNLNEGTRVDLKNNNFSCDVILDKLILCNHLLIIENNFLNLYLLNNEIKNNNWLLLFKNKIEKLF